MSDLYFNNVVFLSHFDGGMGEMSAIDVSNSAHDISFDNTGDAEVYLSTSSKKFGSSSLYSNIPDLSISAQGGFISMPASSDFNFESSPFTLDIYAMWPDVYDSGGDRIITDLFSYSGITGYDLSFTWSFVGQIGGTPASLQFEADVNGSTETSEFYNIDWTPSDGVWYLISLEHDGNGLYTVYVDGVIIDTFTHTDPLFVPVTAEAKMRIGDTTSSTIVGATSLVYLDDARITNMAVNHGGANGATGPNPTRYNGEAFTPSGEAFTQGASNPFAGGVAGNEDLRIQYVTERII